MQEDTQVEKVNKYTVEEVFQAIDEASEFCNTPWREIDEIKWHLLRCTKDPEYKEYLRLKSKFEWEFRSEIMLNWRRTRIFYKFLLWVRYVVKYWLVKIITGYTLQT